MHRNHPPSEQGRGGPTAAARQGRTPWRRGAAGLAGGVLLVLATAGPAAAAAPPPRDITSACPSGTPDSGLDDLGGDGARLAVNCVTAWDVAAGRGSVFAPRETVTRGQMATFLARLLDRTGRGLAAASSDRFADDETSVHEDPINRLADAGLVNGTSATTFSPAGTVTRGQMASFLARALEHALRAEIVPPEDYFSDDAGSVHEANVNSLAAVAVATGTGGTRFSPAAAVTRGQMALFLSRALDFLVDDRAATRPGFPLWQLRPGGVGPFTADMSIAEAERLSPAGFELYEVDTFGGFCFYAESRERRGLFFIVVDEQADDPRSGLLLQASPGGSPDVPADGGIRVGSTRAQVEAAFPGQLRESPNVYRPDTGVYLDLFSGPTDALRFLLDEGVVYDVYAGTRDSIEFIEGCA